MDITTTFSGGRLTIYFCGELDHHAARGTLHTVDSLIEEYLPRECALNMAELSFMDSSGIAVVVRVSRKMRSLSGKVWVEDPPKQPRRVLEAAGIERLVPIAISRMEVQS